MLTQEEINQFKELYLKEFGKEIDDQTTVLLGNNLINLFQAIYRPIQKKETLPQRRKPYINANK